MVLRYRRHRALPLWAAVGLVVLGMGCAAGLGLPVTTGEIRMDYFQAPDTDDVWTPKIRGWQRRERFDASLIEPLDSRRAAVSAGDRATPAALPADQTVEDGLRAKYFRFRVERKRALARELAEWVQRESQQHYREDGPIDHWATLEETLARGGDDCDGLELLAFHALRDLGFAETEIYRAIVVRPSDGQHHMVTLWFEDARDPWVIDPTGAMTFGMPRMSELEDWRPLKVFTDRVEYTVRERSESLARNP